LIKIIKKYKLYEYDKKNPQVWGLFYLELKSC
jgi:hypothetical protein